jgi:hypothetical protein
MVKPNTISMYEKYNNGSSVVAGADVLNGSFGVVTAGVFTNATQATHFVAQVGKNDENYTDFTVPSGADMRAFALKDWAGKYLKVSPEHITYVTSQNYASISAGTTMLVSDASGNLVTSAAAATATGFVYLKVTKKIEFDGNGVLAQILIGA